MGSTRSTVKEACYPGDVIGINNPGGTFAIGDTLCVASQIGALSNARIGEEPDGARCIGRGRPLEHTLWQRTALPWPM
eukprot:564604-Pleurochrysis_carterae.AAC.1